MFLLLRMWILSVYWFFFPLFRLLSWCSFYFCGSDWTGSIFCRERSVRTCWRFCLLWFKDFRFSCSIFLFWFCCGGIFVDRGFGRRETCFCVGLGWSLCCRFWWFRRVWFCCNSVECLWVDGWRCGWRRGRMVVDWGTDSVRCCFVLNIKFLFLVTLYWNDYWDGFCCGCGVELGIFSACFSVILRVGGVICAVWPVVLWLCWHVSSRRVCRMFMWKRWCCFYSFHVENWGVSTRLRVVDFQ